MGYRLGFLGPHGSFGEQAAVLFAPQAELVPQPSNAAVIAAVAAGEIEAGIAPTENSLEGTVAETIDALLRAPDLYIRAELVLPVEQNLIVAPGVGLESITVVMSHPQALGQCRAYLETHLPGARLEATLSTAGAVAEAVQRKDAAAIGPRRAAELHHGAVLAAAIQDVPNNKTRFIVVGREETPPTGNDKTSIAFTVANRPGSLVEVMREFSELQINLTRIESRPSREELGTYIFLIDFEGHRLDAGPARALEAMKKLGARLLPIDRPLGSYPRFIEV